MSNKKLIEVALPLDAINAQSAREKSIRHGHPSTLHLWWARRPLATARAVLFAQLVDDPSERLEEFRADGVASGELDSDAYAEARVLEERERLFNLITRMVDWDNLSDEALFDEVRAEILKSTDGKPPAILDPFAGGGTIPLEAQRLGLEAHASDLNPVAVLINKALIEIPPKFARQPPVFPDAAAQRNDWPKATGLAEDVRRYGAWMRDEAERRIGHLYPKATLPDGTKATVIAWIWARTVTCPNPACGIEMPLVRSWWLSKKKGKESYVVPTIVNGRVDFSIGHDPRAAPAAATDGTVGRTGARCVACDATAPAKYLKAEGQSGGLGSSLIAVVGDGKRSRTYLSPTDEHRRAALVSAPPDVPGGQLADNPRWFSPPGFGMTTFASLFTNRQLTALTTFSDLVGEARTRVLEDAVAAGLHVGERLERGGTDAAAYADAVATYLGLATSRCTDYSSTLCSWINTGETMRNVFGRQAMPMVWDYAEANIVAGRSGGFSSQLGWVAQALELIPATMPAEVQQADAAERPLDNLVLSTDPPYYDNIGYSDLSDFFYVWLRRSLRSVHSGILGTMLVPKAEELVANPHRHGGRARAESFFESGFERLFTRAHASANIEYPSVVYYAFKQSESAEGGESSTGWATILNAIVRAGWQVTATWPVRSERGGRLISVGTNALASSIVIAIRPRNVNAPTTDRRGFLALLRQELPTSLRNLQAGNVAPVDLAQAAIGPGMAIFSRFTGVIEPTGEPMSVRDALQAINGVLDEVLGSQEGDFDTESRWCAAWFEGHGFESGKYGEAETLANAKNASLSTLARSGVLDSGAGSVRLLAPSELPADYDPLADDRISLWEVVMHLSRALQEHGLDASGRMLAAAEQRGVDMTAAHELAYRLFAVAERRGMTDIAIVFNALGSSWADVRAAATSPRVAVTASSMLDFDGLDD